MMPSIPNQGNQHDRIDDSSPLLPSYSHIPLPPPPSSSTGPVPERYHCQLSTLQTQQQLCHRGQHAFPPAAFSSPSPGDSGRPSQTSIA